ncbi:MAG: hypothetical protein ACREX8_20000, partial [Gammaproteobacteria bacterium]
SASGMVTVANIGSLTGFVRLQQADLADVPGALGGRLSQRLHLDVLDVTDSGAPAWVYSGAFAAMGSRPLGYMAPGARRTYRFTATFPGEGTAADNAYAGSSAGVRYVWTGVEGSPPAGAGADRVAPRLRLAFPRVQRILTRRRLLVRARCSESCRLDVRGVLRAGAVRIRLHAIRGRRLRAGRATLLAVRISAGRTRLLRRALAARRTVRFRLSFSARDRAGNRTLIRRTVRLTPHHAARRARHPDRSRVPPKVHALLAREADPDRGLDIRLVRPDRGRRQAHSLEPRR